MDKWDYTRIKKEAKARGVKIESLCALAPNNDGFYTGRDAEIAAAEWFAALWEKFGYSSGVHLRRVHYQIVSQDPPVPRPVFVDYKGLDDGEVFFHSGRMYQRGPSTIGLFEPDTQVQQVYQNTEQCWGYLCNAGKYARYLGLVSAESFVDRRNPEATVCTRFRHPGSWDWEDPNPSIGTTAYEWNRSLPEIPELPAMDDGLPTLPTLEAKGLTNSWDGSLNQQAYHIEVWCEKTTMNDVLEPLVNRYGANLVTGAGELSITAVIEFLKRVAKSDRPARILYVSDFDPAGLGMPISVARKIEFYMRQGDYAIQDIRLQPIVLTADQISEYNLPRVPVKDSDLRKAHFEASHGEGQVELDALEALYPGELAKIVRDAILVYYDEDLDRCTKAVRRDLDERLADDVANVMDAWREDIVDIEAEYDDLWQAVDGLRQEFDELVAPFQARLAEYQSQMDGLKHSWERLADDVASELDRVSDKVDLGEFAVPEPDLPHESDEMLYDSERGYLEQLDYYKSFRSGS